MIHVYNIEVDCAVCAQKIAEKINQVDGVNYASIDFVRSKMWIEYDNNYIEDEVYKEIIKTANKVDPDFCILD